MSIESLKPLTLKEWLNYNNLNPDNVTVEEIDFDSFTIFENIIQKIIHLKIKWNETDFNKATNKITSITQVE